MIKATRFLFALCVVCIVLSLSAQMDIEDAQQTTVVYCDNVHNNVWPDYEGRYKTDCENGEPKKF